MGGLENAQIAVLDLVTGTYKIVLRGGTHAHFVPTGHLVYGFRGALYAVAFDARRAEVTSTPVPVVEGVVISPNGGMDATVAGNGALVYVRGRGVDAAAPRSVVWVDRLGREEPVATVARAFVSPRLSSDGRQALFQITDADDDIWMLDFARNTLARQTFERVEDETPTWSPDGQWIAWSSTEKGLSTILRRRTDGTGEPEALWGASNIEAHMHVNDWTPDGRMLLLSRIGMPGAARSDIAALTLGENRSPNPLLRSAFNVRAARVSPDGRWVAYVSNESGGEQVYVHAFPSFEGKRQISTGGGSEPVWSRQGNELFYRGERALMAVRIAGAPSFSAGVPRKVFDDRYVADAGRAAYDVSPDGRRFLMLKNDAADTQTNVPTDIILVENWLEELKRLVPTN